MSSLAENAVLPAPLSVRRAARATAAKQSTERRILDGAVEALARHGRRKLSMRDISHCAGVSRATLYRYFKTKESVLEAIAAHVTQNARDAFAMAIDERPEPEERLEVVLEALVGYSWVHPEPGRVLELEPEFALAFVRTLLPQWIPIVAETITPAAEHVPCTAQGAVTVEQLAEVLLRVSLSTYLVPSVDVAQVSLWTQLAIAVPRTIAAKSHPGASARAIAGTPTSAGRRRKRTTAVADRSDLKEGT